MTNEQVMNTYDSFLSSFLGCHADTLGNRPCDYGVACDRCSADDFQSAWKKHFNSKLEKEAGF